MIHARGKKYNKRDNNDKSNNDNNKNSTWSHHLNKNHLTIKKKKKNIGVKIHKHHLSLSQMYTQEQMNKYLIIHHFLNPFLQHIISLVFTTRMPRASSV